MRKLKYEERYRKAMVKFWQVMQERQLERIELCDEQNIELKQNLLEGLEWFKNEEIKAEKRLQNMKDLFKSII